MASYEPVIEPEKRRLTPGCKWSLIGCGGFAFLFLVGMGVLFFWVRGKYFEFTSPEPLSFPVVTYGANELKAVKDKMEAMNREEEKEFALNARELNILAASFIEKEVPEGEGERPQVHFEISGEAVRVSFSVPFVWERYVNGQVVLKPVIKDGELDVEILGGELAGKEVSPETLEKFTEEMSKNLQEDPQYQETAQKLERVKELRIEGDELIVIFK